MLGSHAASPTFDPYTALMSLFAERCAASVDASLLVALEAAGSVEYAAASAGLNVLLVGDGFGRQEALPNGVLLGANATLQDRLAALASALRSAGVAVDDEGVARLQPVAGGGCAGANLLDLNGTILLRSVNGSLASRVPTSPLDLYVGAL